MADSKGSPGPGELDKLHEEIAREKDQKAREKAHGRAHVDQARGPTTRPLTQAGGSAPNTSGKVESKDASAEAKIGAKASGTPASMSGTSADGAKDSKQVKQDDQK
jgi:hypothetical protein